MFSSGPHKRYGQIQWRCPMKNFSKFAACTVCVLTVGATCTSTAASASTPTSEQPVYAGPPPVYGGDPAIGETDDSYLNRTGDHVPGLWLANNVAPIFGGDPAIGEIDESYFARTGNHLPRP
jgi:hypothetical protein